MAIEAYRVRKKFQWRGWMFAPQGKCECECADQKDEKGRTNGCTGVAGTGCKPCHNVCNCGCTIPSDLYAGDIWLVEDNHPRKDTMLGNRMAIGDASILAIDELLRDPQYKRLLSPPGAEVTTSAKKRQAVRA